MNNRPHVGFSPRLGSGCLERQGLSGFRNARRLAIPLWSMGVLLLVLLALSPVGAEDPGPSTIAVLDPANGRLLAWYRTDRVVRDQIAAGQETPRFPFTLRFSGIKKGETDHYINFPDPDPASKPREVNPPPASQPDHVGAVRGRPYWLARYKGGERLAFMVTNSSDASYPDKEQGPVGIFGSDGRFHVLVRKTTRICAGRSEAFHDPRLTVAGPYLLVDDAGKGTTCYHLPDGRVQWRAPWHFGHCRNMWGAWYEKGALYVDQKDGLARVDPRTGRILWTWKDAGEIEALRVYPDGRLYVGYIYAPVWEVTQALGKAAVARYRWPVCRGVYFPFFTRVIPFKTSYFGITWRKRAGGDKEAYFDRGTAAVWEYQDGHWSWIFDYECQGKSTADLDKLYSRHGFSSSMRRRMTTRDDDARPYPDEP